MNLPHHRRYQWRIMAKNNKRALYGMLIIAILTLLLLAGEEYMLEHNLRLTRENEVHDLLAAHLKPQIGSPGTVKTDWVEGTERMDK